MRRDSIFYQLFDRSPALLFDLLPNPPENAEGYRFESVAVKEPTFEIDGVFLPPEGTSGIVFFTEVQFQKDEKLYERAFAESFLYFYRNREQFGDWRLVFIYPSRSTEQGNGYPYRVLLESDQVHRIYLNELDDFRQLPLWVGLMVLTTVRKEAEALEKARYLITQSQQQKSQDESRAIIEMVTTIISYQFTQLSRQEIFTMLDINMKETRIYREIAQAAKQEGMQQGMQQGMQEGAANLMINLLSKRFGGLSESVRASIAGLSIEGIEDLAGAQLTFEQVDDLQNWLADYRQ